MININDIPKVGGIYKIVSPTKKIYIGRTKNLKHRFLKYSRLLCEKQPKLYSSLKKYGFDHHTMEILSLTDDNNELNSLEIFYIKQYNTFNTKHGLNLTEGGSGMKKKHTDITKQKISSGLKNSEKFKSTIKSDEYRKKLSNALKGHVGYGKGIKRDISVIEKIKKSVNENIIKNGTRKHTPESKLKMSLNRKGDGNNNAKKCEIIYNDEIIFFNYKKSIKPFLNDLNNSKSLKGPKRYSWYGLIYRGYTNDISLVCCLNKKGG
jgi:group I intron endonuclease